MWTARVDSPIGRLLLVASEAGLERIHLHDEPLATVAAGATEDPQRLAEAIRQLEEYFDGRRTSFDLPLAPRGTPFQLAVWNALREIPHGGTRTYGEIAAAIGRPSACRAVGAANRVNPLPIVVPCHRVIGKDGTLTGFAGGLEMKRRLLEIEAAARV